MINDDCLFTIFSRVLILVFIFYFHEKTEKIIKAKWKGLRDNFRIQWKMIPRDDNDDLLVSPEDFTGTKWQYYRPLLFLADNMGKSRNSYNNSMMDDQSYELLHQFEPAIEIPSEDESEDRKPDILPKINQRLSSPPPAHRASNNYRHESPPMVQIQQKLNSNNHHQKPKLRAIPQLNLMDHVQQLLNRSTVGQTTISPATPLNFHNHNQSAPSSSTSGISSIGKRKRTDEVTTTGCGASSNDEYPTASSPNSNNPATDDDYHFLMSLQPYLNQFNGSQKLRIRMRIQKLIFKELYNGEIDD